MMNVTFITFTPTFPETILFGLELWFGGEPVWKLWGGAVAAWTITEANVGVAISVGPPSPVIADILVLTIGSSDFAHIVDVYDTSPPVIGEPALRIISPINPDAPQGFTYALEAMPEYTIVGISYE